MRYLIWVSVMRVYNYKERWKNFLTPDIVQMLTKIHEYKGRQSFFVESRADSLTQLLEIAKIQSVESSNRIDGICTSDDRIKKIALNKAKPQSRAEEDIAGYREVLSTIIDNHDNIPLKTGYILQFHRDLYKFNATSFRGQYKSNENAVAEEAKSINEFLKFSPLPASEVSEAMENACTAFNDAVNTESIDLLLAIPMFILDFLCIHPFNDGNGRLSRLLTLLLLYRSGYVVGKYISIERMIESTKEQYYATLQKSSAGWCESKNDYVPFVKYMLGIILEAHKDFSERVQSIAESKLSKPERVGKIIREAFCEITKQEISEQCPDISETTVQRALNDLVKKGKIIKISGGRYTSYIWNREDE